MPDHDPCRHPRGDRSCGQLSGAHGPRSSRSGAGADADSTSPQGPRVTPNPGARTVLYTSVADDILRPPLSLILAPGRVGEATDGAEPGSVHVGPDGLSIACADFWYVLSTVKPQGKKAMSARDLLNGILRGLPKGLCGVARPPAAGE